MSGLVELGFVFSCVLGLAVWELVRVRRALREDSKDRRVAAEAAARAGSHPGDGAAEDSANDAVDDAADLDDARSTDAPERRSGPAPRA
ncbi:MAG: hypothetical protein ABIV63_17190 [Caldimonas sp.]